MKEQRRAAQGMKDRLSTTSTGNLKTYAGWVDREVSEGSYGSEDLHRMIDKAKDLTKQRKEVTSLSLNQYAANFSQIANNTSAEDLLKMKSTLDEMINDEVKQRKRDE